MRFHGPRSLSLRGLAPLLLPLLLLPVAGCSIDQNEEAQLCPQPYLLPDASTVTRYDGQGTDIRDMVLTVRLTDVRGSCVGRMGRKTEAAKAHVVMLVGRGPASSANVADVSYSVGVMLHGQILGEKHYVQHVVFPANTDRLEVRGQDVTFALPTGKAAIGPDYHLYFWLDLTPEELAANRNRPEASGTETGNAISLAPGQ